MKQFVSFLVLIFFAACNAGDNNAEPANEDSSLISIHKDSALNYIHTFADTALENKITAALLKLPFVKKSNAYIDSFSNHTAGISFMLENPAAGESEISVQAGHNGDQRFETYYRFFVDAKTLAIKVYDPVADKKLSIKEYLKTQK